MSLPFDANPPPCGGNCDNCDLDCDLLKDLMHLDDKKIKTVRVWRDYVINGLNEGWLFES